MRRYNNIMNKINIFLVIVILLLCSALWNDYKTRFTDGFNFGMQTDEKTWFDSVYGFLPSVSTNPPNKMEQGDIMMTDVHCDDQGTGACLCPMYQKELFDGQLHMWDEKAMDYCVDNGLINFNRAEI